VEFTRSDIYGTEIGDLAFLTIFLLAVTTLNISQKPSSEAPTKTLFIFSLPSFGCGSNASACRWMYDALGHTGSLTAQRGNSSGEAVPIDVDENFYHREKGGPFQMALNRNTAFYNTIKFATMPHVVTPPSVALCSRRAPYRWCSLHL